MTSLLELPSVRLFHLPTASSASEPLPFANGPLTLSILPPTPTHPAETLTLTVGSASFPLSKTSPVHKVHAPPTQHAHATYVFTPSSPEGTGESYGQVRVVMKDSSSPGEYDATEALARIFESTLTQHGVLDEKVLNSETRKLTVHNWGDTAASSLIGAATSLANKLTSFTESHVTTTHPFNTRKPPVEAVAGAYQTNIKTAQFAEAASENVTQFGTYVQQGGKKLGGYLPESVTKPIQGQIHAGEEDKSDIRKGVEEGWSQFTTVAKGLATAVGTVGAAVSDSTHKAVEHSFGTDADKVAQDLGQAGANVAGVGIDAARATSVVVQGGNLATGISATGTDQPVGLNTTPADKPEGYHGKPIKVFSDEKQAELLETAMK